MGPRGEEPPETPSSTDEGPFLRLPVSSTAAFEADARITDDAAPRRIHVVLSGVVRLSVVARDGRERVVSYLSRGSIFGEQQALTEALTPSASVAIADTPCVIGYVEPDELMTRLQSEPELLRTLLRITHQKKQHLVEEIERAAFQGARSQIASLLAALARDAHDPSAITMSQERLARLSGRTRVTVAAQLHALESAGAIRLERSRIVVVDPDTLAALAGDP